MLKTSSHLRKALKDAGLPHSYPTYLRYLKTGLIPVSQNKMDTKSIYTDEDIAEAVKRVKEHLKI